MSDLHELNNSIELNSDAFDINEILILSILDTSLLMSKILTPIIRDVLKEFSSKHLI